MFYIAAFNRPIVCAPAVVTKYPEEFKNAIKVLRTSSSLEKRKKALTYLTTYLVNNPNVLVWDNTLMYLEKTLKKQLDDPKMLSHCLAFAKELVQVLPPNTGKDDKKRNAFVLSLHKSILQLGSVSEDFSVFFMLLERGFGNLKPRTAELLFNEIIKLPIAQPEIEKLVTATNEAFGTTFETQTIVRWETSTDVPVNSENKQSQNCPENTAVAVLQTESERKYELELKCKERKEKAVLSLRKELGAVARGGDECDRILQSLKDNLSVPFQQKVMITMLEKVLKQQGKQSKEQPASAGGSLIAIQATENEFITPFTTPLSFQKGTQFF